MSSHQSQKYLHSDFLGEPLILIGEFIIRFKYSRGLDTNTDHSVNFTFGSLVLTFCYEPSQPKNTTIHRKIYLSPEMTKIQTYSLFVFLRLQNTCKVTKISKHYSTHYTYVKIFDVYTTVIFTLSFSLISLRWVVKST